MLLPLFALTLGLLALGLLGWVVFRLVLELFSDRDKRLVARLDEAGSSHTPKAADQVIGRATTPAPGATDGRQSVVRAALTLRLWTARVVARAGRSDAVATVWGFCALCAAIGLGLPWLLGSPWWLALAVGALAAALPYALLGLLAERRQALIERQLPDLLDFVARSMSAGHDFNGALKLAVAEAPQPIGQEFQRAFDEMNYGGTVHDAMRALVQRIECPSMLFFAVAVIINREVGGSLAGLLGDVADQVRERLTFRLKVRALTGEGRASALILGVMPFLIASALLLVSRDYLLPLVTEPAGRRLLLVGLLGMGVGFVWMHRLIRIRL